MSSDGRHTRDLLLVQGLYNGSQEKSYHCPGYHSWTSLGEEHMPGTRPLVGLNVCFYVFTMTDLYCTGVEVKDI